jgi:uncharacterized membrane protein
VRKGDRRNTLGEPAPVVLVVADTVRDGMDGREVLAAAPSALYGTVLLMSGIAYMILQQQIISSQPEDSLLKKAVGKDWKGKMSPVIYAVAIAAAFRAAWISQALYALAALIWLAPDRRIEKAIVQGEG